MNDTERPPLFLCVAPSGLAAIYGELRRAMVERPYEPFELSAGGEPDLSGRRSLVDSEVGDGARAPRARWQPASACRGRRGECSRPRSAPRRARGAPALGAARDARASRSRVVAPPAHRADWADPRSTGFRTHASGCDGCQRRSRRADRRDGLGRGAGLWSPRRCWPRRLRGGAPPNLPRDRTAPAGRRHPAHRGSAYETDRRRAELVAANLAWFGAGEPVEHTVRGDDGFVPAVAP